MNRELCSYGGKLCADKCVLLESAEVQARAGGFERRDFTGPSGPFWKRDTWNGFMDGTIIAAEEDGCVELEALKSRIPQITQQKVNNEEFI